MAERQNHPFQLSFNASGADDPRGEEIVLGWTQMGVHSQPPEGQKLIPVD